MNPSGSPGGLSNGGDSDSMQSPSERRRGPDRRKQQIPVAVERRSGRDRREDAKKMEEEKSERRRMVDPTTCEREYGDEETEFMLAMDQYKRANRRPFPTWSEVLEVLKALGYRKVDAPKAIPGLPIPKTTGSA
jgi:hypothetical protein